MANKKFKRIALSEITLSRLGKAVLNRVSDIPHFLAWNLLSLAAENRKSLEDFRNIHLGKRCFIIANGPSLINTNLDLLNQEITFGLNRIYLNFEKSKFRPTYYVAVNELILEQFSSEIEALQMPKFINWNERTRFTLTNNNLYFIKPKLAMADTFQPDATKPMVFGATVTYAALQIAYFMGFNKVILVGLDHNYAEKGVPNSVEKRKNALDLSHFDQRYFPKGVKWQLPDLVRSEYDYSLAKKAFEQDGRQIIDATVDGKCAVFTKGNLLSEIELPDPNKMKD